jgi:hypothetical protein
MTSTLSRTKSNLSKLLGAALRPAILDRNGAPVDAAEFAQASRNSPQSNWSFWRKLFLTGGASRGFNLHLGDARSNICSA